MDSKPAKISIIIPCYNMEAWVEEAIQSGLIQEGVIPEVIVIDDGSTDRSLEVIKKFKENILWETGPNQGVNAARNRGLAKATGKYALFLDADDFLEHNGLGPLVGEMEKQDLDLCYGNFYRLVTQTDGRRIKSKIQKAGFQADLLLSLLCGWQIPVWAYVFRRQFLIEQRLFWDSVHLHPGDFAYTFSVAFANPKQAYASSVVGCYREHREGRMTNTPQLKTLTNLVLMCGKVESRLKAEGLWRQPYIHGLCNTYLGIARAAWRFDRKMFHDLLKKIHALDSQFRSRRPLYDAAVGLFGYEGAQRLSEAGRAAREFLTRRPALYQK